MHMYKTQAYKRTYAYYMDRERSRAPRESERDSVPGGGNRRRRQRSGDKANLSKDSSTKAVEEFAAACAPTSVIEKDIIEFLPSFLNE
jgi:hypothetical protein